MERRIRLFNKPLPFTCLLLICVLLSAFIFEQYYANAISNDFANDSHKVVFSGEIWRLYTSFFTNSNVFSLLLSIYLLIMEGGAFENRIGSITYLILFTVKHFLVSTLFCVIQTLVEGIFGYARGHIAGGAWMVILSDLISRTLANPEETRICRTITNRMYSAILLVIAFALSDFGVQIFAVIGVAAIEFYLFNGLLVRPSRSRILWLENYTCCACITKKVLFFTFVSVEECNASFFRIEQSDRMEVVDDEESSATAVSQNHFESDEHQDSKRKRSSDVIATHDEFNEQQQQEQYYDREQELIHHVSNESKNVKNNNLKQDASFYDGNTVSGKIAMEQTYFSQAGFKPATKDRDDCLENIDEDLYTDVEDVQQQRAAIFTQHDQDDQDQS